MKIFVLSTAVLTAVASSSFALTVSPPYTATPVLFGGSAFAFNSNGYVAVASDNFSGGATIKVYNSLANVNGSPIQTFTSASWQYIAGISFADNNTIVFGENSQGKLYTGNITTGSTNNFAAASAVQDIYVDGTNVLATLAGGPGNNDVISVPITTSGTGTVSTVINHFGTGYAGGLTKHAGKWYVADTNDPTFIGTPGKVMEYDSSFTALRSLSLSTAGASGAYDVEFDSTGNLYATAGSAIVKLDLSGASPVASTFASFDAGAFPTFLGYTGSAFSAPGDNGKLFVNGAFTEAGGTFAIIVPEPTSILCVAPMILALLRRRRA